MVDQTVNVDINNKAIPFTQYLRPFGRQERVWIDFDEPEVLTKAQMIIDAGYVFECEELMNGLCSFTINDNIDNEGDVAIQLCDNGPAVPIAVRKLIMEFNHER